MDSYEASSLIFTKVKSIDPENAKKIMGYILIQDLAENDLMRLAFGPENLLHSMVIRARIHLGLSSNNSSTPSSPSTLNPIQRPSAAGNPFFLPILATCHRPQRLSLFIPFSKTSIEDIVAKIISFKQQGKPKSELRELVTQMFVHFVNLRQANHAILLEEEHVRCSPG